MWSALCVYMLEGHEHLCPNGHSILRWLKLLSGLTWTKLGLLYKCLQNTLRFHTSASPSDFSPIRQLFLCISFSLSYCGRKYQPALHKAKHQSRTPVALRNAGVLPRSLERCFLSTWFLPKTAHQLWVNILLVPAYASTSKQRELPEKNWGEPGVKSVGLPSTLITFLSHKVASALQASGNCLSLNLNKP